MRSLLLATMLAAFAGLGGVAATVGSTEGRPPSVASRWDRVTVPPSKTSIYIGSVTLTMPAFARRSATYESVYTAKVVPYFFFNESGRIAIDFSDEQLSRLARGEAVEFTGRGVRDDGAERRVEGKATPTDALTGKLKVRVFVTKRTELIFNTTYRFEP